MESISEPLVSVIMPSFNAADTIEESIRSVLQQSYKNWELLITDDCSHDMTYEILKNYASRDSRIKVAQLEKNSGAGIARNHCIRRATGRYIAFLDADDQWYPEKLKKQIAFMRDNDLALSYSAYDQIENGVNKAPFIPPKRTSYHELLKTCVIGCLTAIYDCERCGKRYMPTIRKRQDFALWLSILKDGHKAGGLQDVTALYRLDGGMSQNKFKVLRDQWRVYREVERIPLLKTLFYFSHYAINGIKKHY